MRITAVRASMVFALALGIVTACDDEGSSNDDGGAGTGAVAADAGGGDQGGAAGEQTAGRGGEGGQNELVPCLESPDALERPPAGRLPCDLLPPDFPR